MKVRIKFQKYDAMKFIGHLDVMRYFQKAFRRAGFDNEYTKGFSPHQIMSFAAPLGVGLTSDGEYVDVELRSSDTPEVMVERLNAVMTEGFRITGFMFLKEREENRKNVTAMAQVSSADYLVSLKDGYAVPDIIDTPEKLRESFREFYAAEEIVIDKKTKTSEKTVDIKPMITLVAFTAEEYEEQKVIKQKLIQGSESNSPKSAEATATESSFIGVMENRREYKQYVSKPVSVAEVYRNGIKVYLQLNTGSAMNLKPELVMEAFFNSLGHEYLSYAWQVHRLEVYSRDEADGRLIPLEELER